MSTLTGQTSYVDGGDKAACVAEMLTRVYF
jgi:hypothetical protein